jgi:hypothetical protein
VALLECLSQATLYCLQDRLLYLLHRLRHAKRNHRPKRQFQRVFFLLKIYPAKNEGEFELELFLARSVEGRQKVLRDVHLLDVIHKDVQFIELLCGTAVPIGYPFEIVDPCV